MIYYIYGYEVIVFSRILGIDLGDRRIGLAVSDETKVIARGLEVIHVKKKVNPFDYLKKIVSDYKVSEIVVGLPKNMDGTLGERAEKTREFGSRIGELLPEVKVVYIDERLTTVEATNILLSADVSRKKRKYVVDKLSAVIILQNYLDRLKVSETYDRNDNSK